MLAASAANAHDHSSHNLQKNSFKNYGDISSILDPDEIEVEDDVYSFSLPPLRPNAQAAKDYILEKYPQIKIIHGVRQDHLCWHRSGKAIDIMIPNWNKEEGIKLGYTIVYDLLSRTEEYESFDLIWRQKYYSLKQGFNDPSPMNDRGSPTQNHYDHIHFTVDKDDCSKKPGP